MPNSKPTHESGTERTHFTSWGLAERSQCDIAKGGSYGGAKCEKLTKVPPLGWPAWGAGRAVAER